MGQAIMLCYVLQTIMFCLFFFINAYLLTKNQIQLPKLSQSVKDSEYLNLIGQYLWPQIANQNFPITTDPFHT